MAIRRTPRGPFATARAELHTLRDWLRFAVSRFAEAGLHFGHGTHQAYDEAAYLLLHALHLPLDRLEPFLDARVTRAEAAKVAALLDRRVIERTPAAYLTKEAWLGDLRFYVDERVIVPRSFIAELLREHLAPWVPDPGTVGSVLDLCTGSGCLAIAAALAFPDASVDGVDISRDALAVAQVNSDAYGLNDRVRLVRSDLFAKIGGRRYDVIVSNPPYVDAPSMRTLPEEYRHEPRLALAGGADGLAIVRQIIAGAPEHLTEEGILVVEIGHNRDALEAAYPRLSFTWLETSAGDEHVFMLRRADLSV
jgi:ribosomal protein L3 glutamine methyltransferase